MYRKLELQMLNTIESVINLKFCGGKAATGKEMTQSLVKLSVEAKFERVLWRADFRV